MQNPVAPCSKEQSLLPQQSHSPEQTSFGGTTATAPLLIGIAFLALGLPLAVAIRLGVVRL